MKKLIQLVVISVFCFVPMQMFGDGTMNIYDFTVTDMKGNSVSLGEYRGSAVMIVNVASKCGFTPQYEGLQTLYERYKDRGFVILGFPANNFLGQEPGSNEEIAQFCSLNYGVTFPMFEKISVAGRDIHPLYEYLTSKQEGHDFGGRITWNFNKFLIDGEGNIVARYPSKTEPLDQTIVTDLENALN